MPFDAGVQRVHTALSLAIEQAIKLIEKPENWCQHELSQEVNGVRQYCIEGSLIAAACHTAGLPLCAVALHPGCLRRASSGRRWSSMDVVYFNDTHTHGEVLALMRKAVELAKKDVVNAV